MPKIDILSAIYKIKRAWDGVSALTIQRCFRKAGFKGDFLFGDSLSGCEENDEFNDISSFEKKLNFDKYAYVSIDSNFPARGLLSDVEIISSVNNTAQNDDSDSDVEEIEKPKKPVISSKEAIDKINDLKDFFLNKNQDFSKIVDFLFNIENVVIEKCNTKQTSIKDFVKKQ